MKVTENSSKTYNSYLQTGNPNTNNDLDELSTTVPTWTSLTGSVPSTMSETPYCHLDMTLLCLWLDEMSLDRFQHYPQVVDIAHEFRCRNFHEPNLMHKLL